MRASARGLVALSVALCVAAIGIFIAWFVLEPKPAWRAATSEAVPETFRYLAFVPSPAVSGRDAPIVHSGGYTHAAVLVNHVDLQTHDDVRVQTAAGIFVVPKGELRFVLPHDEQAVVVQELLLGLRQPDPHAISRLSMTTNELDVSSTRAVLRVGDDDSFVEYAYDISGQQVSPISLTRWNGKRFAFQFLASGCAVVIAAAVSAVLVLRWRQRKLHRSP
jgi:hypothetical protein